MGCVGPEQDGLAQEGAVMVGVSVNSDSKLSKLDAHLERASGMRCSTMHANEQCRSVHQYPEKTSAKFHDSILPHLGANVSSVPKFVFHKSLGHWSRTTTAWRLALKTSLMP